MPPYRYSSLSHKRSIIRLLRLLPSKDERENLQCELLEYTLRDSDTAYHPYEALSYAWGGEKKPKSITIIDDQKDDQELAVTQNLYTALLHLRDHEISRIIWADAVCINQANEEEKEHQIQFMAAIYAKASHVIVWLGEAQAESDRALELIRIAGEKSVEPSNTEPFEQAILQLLERPWFSRIWVLQEVAAARHVIIMCGSAQIDGYAFCLGLDIFKTLLEDSKYLVASLLRGAMFRSGQISKKQGRLTLDICSLGELFDIYHDYNATKRHDKVYALLAMSSDDLSVAGLEPDYNVPWETLMRSLVKFLLGDHASIDTWNDRKTAVIKSKGCTLGHVSSITTKLDNRRCIQISFNYLLENPKHCKNRKVYWTLPSSAKPVKEGDVICVLQGVQKPTIVRSFGDYFAIIMITAIPSEHIQAGWQDLLQLEERFTRDFLLVWDWEKSSEILQDRGKYDTLIRTSPKLGLEGQLDKAATTWNFAQILGDSGQHQKAKERELEAIKVFKRTLKGEHLHRLESQYSPIPLLWAAANGHNEAVSLILAEGGVDLNVKDWRGRTPLLWASKNGHEAIIELLLKTDKTEVDPKDDNGRTPLSWAAENRNEAIIKLLLKTDKAEVDSEDDNGRTPLSWAAGIGHKAIVKLLLKTGKTKVDSKDNYGRTPLSWAARNGHEAVINLLLETGKAEVDSKDNYGRTPFWRAAKNGHEATAKLLLCTGKIEVDSKDNYSRTPLWRAAGNGHEAIVKLLLETGKAEADSKDNYGRTPLLWAAENGHKVIVNLLLETGKVKVNSKDNYNRTPLSRAAGNGHEAIVKLLLEIAKIEIDSKDSDSRTPLSWAAGNGHEAIVKLMLEAGKAKADSKDDDGRTPLSWAAGNGHEAIVKLLQPYS